MKTPIATSLRPLLESSDGVHLTAYLVNRGTTADLKAQVREVLGQANDYLVPVMSAADRTQFLEPLETLASDNSIFNKIRGNVGIFRTQDSFRVLNIPVEVEPICSIASSFHVKPLLKWLQSDREFILIGLEPTAAHLYLGSQTTLRSVDSIAFPKGKKRKFSTLELDVLPWFNEWLPHLTKGSKPALFFAGEQDMIDHLNQNLKYSNAYKIGITGSFDPTKVEEAAYSVRAILRAEARKYIEKSLLEFRFAEEGNRVRKNLFQVSKAVVQGRVQKLIVADDMHIFGKIDKKSGGLAIHPCDLDHEDDDILDDLAQLVLSQGGEVVIASRDEMPKGRPVLAILDFDEKHIEKSTTAAQYAVYQERSV